MRALLAICVLASFCSAADLSVGSPAPPLTLNQLWQAPPGASVTWQALHGDAVVLEFWATWCGACREQIPRWNKLEEQFSRKPVRFLWLTDEEPGLVRRFLRDYRIAAWIGLDANEQTFQRYGISVRPTTVLVDGGGVVRGIGNAADLIDEIIENLLTGNPIAFSMESSTAKLETLPEPVYQTMVRPAAPVQATGFSPGAVRRFAARKWETWGVSLRRLLSDAYAVPENRIEAPAWAATDRYDVVLAAPGLDQARRLALLRRTLDETFQIKVHKESRETDVYVLRRRPGTEPELRPAAPTGSSRWGKNGEITAVSMPLIAIAAVAEQALGKAVVDETGMPGRFDFELKWDSGNPQSLIDAVRSQLGLDLSPSRRLLDYLVVDSATEPRAW